MTLALVMESWGADAVHPSGAQGDCSGSLERLGWGRPRQNRAARPWERGQCEPQRNVQRPGKNTEGVF